MREGTTSRVMAADRPCGAFNDFYRVSPECFGYTLVCIVRNCGVLSASSIDGKQTNLFLNIRTHKRSVDMLRSVEVTPKGMYGREVGSM
jgi:hypothetical protein